MTVSFCVEFVHEEDIVVLEIGEEGMIEMNIIL